MAIVSETKSSFMFCRYVVIFAFALRSPFQLSICNAIRIPIATSTISPIAYFLYFPVLFFSIQSYRIFPKNLIIGLEVDHNESERFG